MPESIWLASSLITAIPALRFLRRAVEHTEWVARIQAERERRRMVLPTRSSLSVPAPVTSPASQQ